MDGTLFHKIEERATDRYAKVERKLHHEEPQEAVDFCLNCTKKTCGGNCQEYKAFRKEDGVGKKYSSKKMYVYQGKEYSAAQLGAIAGVSANSIHTRINNGMTAEEAVAMGNKHSHYKRIGRNHKCKE